MPYRHRISSIKRVGDYLLAKGVAPADALRRIELPSSLLLHDDAWVDRRQSFQLLQDVSALASDPLAGLHISSLIQFPDYGFWGEGVMRSNSLNDAIGFAAREIGRIETGTRVYLRVECGKAYLRVGFDGPTEADPRQHFDADLLTLRQMLNLAVEHVPARARLPHESHPHAELEWELGSDLEFSTGVAELVFDAEALSLPLKQFPHGMIPRNGHAETARAVQRELFNSFGQDAVISAAGVAEKLSMNLRTMQRHLGSWGVSFQEILDQCRYRSALDQLRAGMLVIDIAFHLGYSDAAHFSRAFKRWTGVAPAEARRRIADLPQDTETPQEWPALQLST
ncbi:MAG: AraC family transcriptional regulator ligand-binding domain-containing protein [Pseudomonadales bacterium]